MQKFERYANVDGLRLLCAFAVLLFHYGYRGSLDGLYAPLLPWTAISDPMKYGHIGVHVFFSISGFVIAYSATGRSAFSFAAARFARIYPTFILCLTILFGARLLWGGPELPTSLAQYLTGFAILPKPFGQDFLSGVYWSIVVELLFYAWVFVLLLSGLFQRYTLQIITIWLALSAVNEVLLGHIGMRMLLVTEFAPYFAFGMLLQHVQVARLTWPVAGLLAGATGLGVAVLLRETNDIRNTYHIAMSDLVSVALLLAGLAALVWAVEVKRPLLPLSLLAWAGGISYPLYLLHEGLGQVAFVRLRSIVDGSLLFGFATFAMIFLASVVWWCFDRHAVPWTRRQLDRLAFPSIAAIQMESSGL
jgi:peptidoglycan/LPS O-acetylase OafA/YrhL